LSGLCTEANKIFNCFQILFASLWRQNYSFLLCALNIKNLRCWLILLLIVRAVIIEIVVCILVAATHSRGTFWIDAAPGGVGV
jgi:hypothetical protein